MLDKPDRRARPKTKEQGASAIVAPPCAMVIFGAAGDLTKRLVVPALYNGKRPPAV
jgi:glucose-6-phosphate 1-dehydrogenase